MSEWKNGVFGCFSDCTLCEYSNYYWIMLVISGLNSTAGLLSFFCPCYQFGKNAEQVGEECFTYGLSHFIPILNWYCRTVIRGKIREQRGIEGSFVNDLLCVMFCYACTLAQESLVSFFIQMC